MFSTGHIMWICISLFLIAGGLILVKIRKPAFDDVLKVCFFLGIIFELVKIFAVAQILPVVDPVITGGEAGEVLSYLPAGQYSPYIENSHLPFELCSLQLLFYAIVIWSSDPKWKERFTALIFVTGIIGGLLGIVLSSIAPEHQSVRDFFTSPRAWQFFLYHSMVVTVGIVAGFSEESKVSFKDLKNVLPAIISLDIISFYFNSIFSDPVYENAKPVALLYRTNFFSSYVNPLGLVLTEKWQWLTYLILRLLIASAVILTLFLIQRLFRGSRKESTA